MWILFACGSALFVGITAILAKIGIRDTDSNVATAIRTVIVLLFSWLMVFVVGSQDTLGSIRGETLLFLILSGVATGASWLCYFRALQLGDVNKVTPIDKSSTVITMLLAFLLLEETVTVLKAAAMVVIGAGTLLMITRKEKAGSAGAAQKQGKNSRKWLPYALLSALFASLTAILGKVGISGVESNLGTAIRTIVVLLMAWVMVFVTGKQKEVAKLDGRSLLFICISGVTTGLSWLCYYKALQDGPASVVVPIDKLSILVTVAFSWWFLKEKLSPKAGAGLVLIVAGTLLLLV